MSFNDIMSIDVFDSNTYTVTSTITFYNDNIISKSPTSIINDIQGRIVSSTHVNSTDGDGNIIITRTWTVIS
jgi:hypothetical protein